MSTDNKSAYDSNIYDEHIVNVLPYYREYHDQIIDLVESYKPGNIRWLDTGCGTGTLASMVFARRDDVKFTLCDPSEKMLIEAKKKLKEYDISFVNKASHELESDSEFDVITAVQCHHYYQPDEREEAVRHCYKALKETGIFITFENIRMSTDESDAIALKRWVKFLGEHGNTEKGIQLQLDRRGVETFPISIEEHINLLRRCGFKSVDILWASYLQVGIWAVK
ncbi:MAG TPA: class I SAM-dependent methyltransferase [Lachnospiraceae bacterium]|nr:class I SAM-dependent methyltransferase [Lachnospiraceae bacterium]